MQLENKASKFKQISLFLLLMMILKFDSISSKKNLRRTRGKVRREGTLVVSAVDEEDDRDFGKGKNERQR